MQCQCHFYGFSEADAARVCQEGEIDLDEARSWYGGYQVPGVGSVFHPNSLTCAMHHHSLRSEWTGTRSFLPIMQAIEEDRDGVLEKIRLLAQGEKVPAKTDRMSNGLGVLLTSDDVLTCLAHLGCLTCFGKEKDGERSLLGVPNRETQGQLKAWLPRENADEAFRVQTAMDAMDLNRKLLRQDMEGVARALDETRKKSGPLYTGDGEDVLRCTVLERLCFSMAEFTLLKKEWEGAPDFLYEPQRGVNSLPVAIELKSLPDNEDGEEGARAAAETALSRLRRTDYTRVFPMHRQYLLVAICYDVLRGKHTCVCDVLYSSRRRW